MIRREYTIRRNVEWGKFLDSLDEPDKATAIKTFEFLIDMCPELEAKLRGDVIWTESKILEA